MSYIQELYHLSVLSKRLAPPPSIAYLPVAIDQPFQCPYEECSKLFSRSMDLYNHLLQCHQWSPKRYWCQWPGCNYKTTTVVSITSHLRMHSTNKPYECKVPACTYRTQFPSNLKTHYVSHDDWRPFACEWPDCGQRFKTKLHLKRHIVRAHKGDAPSACVFVCHRHNCFKRYKEKSSLTRHVKSTHTSATVATASQEPVPETGKSSAPNAVKVTAYKCYAPGCQYSASTSNALKYHCLIH